MADQSLTLHAKAEGFDQAAGKVRQVTEAERDHAEAVLNTQNVGKQSAAIARRTIENYNLQQAAAREHAQAELEKAEALRKAMPAAQALAAAEAELLVIEKQLAEAMKTGTVGQVESLQKRYAATAQTVQSLSPAQSKVNLSLEGLSRILGNVNPELGALVSQMQAFNQQTKQSTSTIPGLNTEIGRLAASGIAAAGFSAFAFSIKTVREESEKLREELKKLKQAQTDVDKATIEAGQDIDIKSRTRKEGGLRDTEKAEAERIFAQVTRQGRVRDTDALTTNLASLTGVASPEDIEGLSAIGVSIEPTGSRASRERRANRALAKHHQAIADEFADVESERARRRASAALELSTSDPTVGNANADVVLDRIAPNGNRENILDIARKLRDPKFNTSPFGKPRDDATVDEVIRNARAPIAHGVFGFDTAGGTPAEFDAARRLNDATRTTVVNITNNNARNVGSDAAAEARRRRNGENTNGQY